MKTRNEKIIDFILDEAEDTTTFIKYDEVELTPEQEKAHQEALDIVFKKHNL